MNRIAGICLVSLGLLLLAPRCDGGLFVGIALVERGLVVLEPSESGQGPGRVVDRVRVELGDVIRVGKEGRCRLIVYEGSVLRLGGGDYRVTRTGLMKMLDGGDLPVFRFRCSLGARTQWGGCFGAPKAAGKVRSLSGRVFVRHASDEDWRALGPDVTDFMPGDQLRCDEASAALVEYANGSRARILSSTVLWLLSGGLSVEHGAALVETSGGAAGFHASMSFIEPRRPSLFLMREEPDGCRLHVVEGAVLLCLTAQGLPSRALVRAGFRSRLTRAGLVERPVRFIRTEAVKAWVSFISGRLAAVRLDPQIADLFGLKRTGVPEGPGSSSAGGEQMASHQSGADMRKNAAATSRPKPFQRRATAGTGHAAVGAADTTAGAAGEGPPGRPGAQDDRRGRLKDVFRLPGMFENDRHRSLEL